MGPRTATHLVLSRKLASLALLACGLTVSACDKAEPAVAAAPKAASAAEAVAKAEPVAQAQPVAKAQPAAKPQPAPTPVVNSELAPPGNGAQAIDRARFPEPSWFNAQIFPGATVKHQGHSAPREDGTFSSSLLLEAPSGMPAADCIEGLKGKVDVEMTWSAAEEGKGGRQTVRGDGERYFVTLVCGEVKGKTVASVNYTWTK